MLAALENAAVGRDLVEHLDDVRQSAVASSGDRGGTGRQASSHLARMWHGEPIDGPSDRVDLQRRPGRVLVKYLWCSQRREGVAVRHSRSTANLVSVAADVKISRLPNSTAGLQRRRIAVAPSQSDLASCSFRTSASLAVTRRRPRHHPQ